jgi:hypothetical protein
VATSRADCKPGPAESQRVEEGVPLLSTGSGAGEEAASAAVAAEDTAPSFRLVDYEQHVARAEQSQQAPEPWACALLKFCAQVRLTQFRCSRCRNILESVRHALAWLQKRYQLVTIQWSAVCGGCPAAALQVPQCARFPRRRDETARTP